MELGEEALIFLTGFSGALIWVILSYYVIPNFKMEISLFGEKTFICVWCFFGGFFAWLLPHVESCGLHPAMFCAVLTGFGWSGIFTGISSVLIYRRNAKDTDTLIDDVMG